MANPPQLLDIVDLRDRPSLLPAVMDWHADGWGKIRPCPEIEAMYRACLGGAANEFTLVGLIGGVPAGMASLRPTDLFYGRHRHLTPWLDSVYVAHAFRRRGVAAALCRAVIDRAASLGAPALYLGTEDDSAARIYGAVGFLVLETTQVYGERAHVIMRRPMADGSGKRALATPA